MAATMLLVTALMAQSAFAPPAVPTAGPADFAYEELTKGAPQAVREQMEEAQIASDDPAALINLGAAYARRGQNKKAMECYMAAIASDTRYDVQLGDGRWMDSRRAARMAVEALSKGRSLALAEPRG